MFLKRKSVSFTLKGIETTSLRRLFDSEVPVVSWTPLRSAEQLGPLALFVLLQLRALKRGWAAAVLGLALAQGYGRCEASSFLIFSSFKTFL